MHRSPSLFVLFASVIATSPAVLAAQQQIHPTQRRGILSAAPVGLLLDSTSNEVVISDSGVLSSPPAAWDSGRFGTAGLDHPDYSLSAIFGTLAPLVKLSGVSTGNDIMPKVETDGSFDMSTLARWSGLTISVTNSAVGQGGSHPARLYQAQDTPGAELFTYYFEGSQGIAPSLVNTTVSERSREMLLLPTNGDVSGMDYGLGFIPADPNFRTRGQFMQRDLFFFTLDSSCLGLLGNSFAIDPDNGNQLVPARSSSIYRTRWITASGGGYEWSTPEVYRSHSDLGLSISDQLDAIAVDAAGEREIFSTAGAPRDEQLMVRQEREPAVAPIALHSGATKVVDKVRLTEGDDIDATCAIDPEAGKYSVVFGTPLAAYTDTPGPPLGISFVRAVDSGVNTDEYFLSVTGTDLGTAPLGMVSFFAIDATSTGGVPSPLQSSAWTHLLDLPVLPGQTEVSFRAPAPPLAPANSPRDVRVVGYFTVLDPVTLVPVVTRSSWVSRIEG